MSGILLNYGLEVQFGILTNIPPVAALQHASCPKTYTVLSSEAYGHPTEPRSEGAPGRNRGPWGPGPLGSKLPTRPLTDLASS